MMILLVLLGGILAFRGIGALGVDAFASWPAATRWGLSLMLFFTASAHFTSMKEDLVRMVPAWVPVPRAMVTVTGVLELLGAVGILLPGVKRLAGLGLVALFVCLFPANVHAARAGLTLRGRPATRLLLRIPMQALFNALTWWSTQSSS